MQDINVAVVTVFLQLYPPLRSLYTVIQFHLHYIGSIVAPRTRIGKVSNCNLAW